MRSFAKQIVERLPVLLEAYLSHGTARAASADVLLIRRARGFGLIGLASLLLGGVVVTSLNGIPEVALVSAAMMAILAGSVALGFPANGRLIRPITHAGMASMLAGIVGVGMYLGYVNPIGSTVPILLVLAATYVLGVLPGLFWTLASMAAMAWTVFALELATPPAGAVAVSKVGLLFTNALVLAGVYALAATERHFGDVRRLELDFLARHDPLTGLLNRRALEDDLRNAWKRCARHGRRFAVLVIDLDDFKATNDEHGHGVGDALLVDLARRIAEMTRETDRACRVGGDEFVLLLEDVSENKNVALAAERLLEVLCAPVRIDELEVFVNVSIGLAVYPDAASDPEHLMKLADLSMYDVKAVGGNALCFYGEPELSSARLAY